MSSLRRRFVRSLFATTLLFPVFARAQGPASPPAPAEETKRFGVGADAAFVLPIGNLADAASIGLGALGKFEYAATPSIAVTARAGFIYHLSKDLPGGNSVGISVIPILGGIKFYPVEKSTGFYLAPEAGLMDVIGRATVATPVGSGSASSSDAKFGLVLGAGYQLGDLDFRGSLMSYDVGHFGDAMSVMANVGYRFAQF